MDQLHPTDTYHKIGRFMRLTQLSRKALRLYEQLNILVPAYTDPASGYRHYADAQIGTARLIRMLREMEMPLADIRQIIEARAVGDSERAEQQIVQYERHVAQRAAYVEQTAITVKQMILMENKQMSFEITVSDIPAQRIVAHLARVELKDWQTHIPKTLDKLRTHILTSGGSIAGDPICFYHGPINEEADGPVEICWPFAGTVEATDELSVRELPAHKLASHHAELGMSRFPNVLQVWDCVLDWAKSNEYYDSLPQGMGPYERWPADGTVAVGWPFAAAP